MKKHINIFRVVAYAVIGLAFAFDSVFAQDTIYNESVIINVGFNPIVNDANKVVETPSIFDTSYSHIDLTFEKIDKGYQIRLKFDTIKPAQVKGEPVAKLYNFHLKGGLGIGTSKVLGTGFVPYVQASYSSLRDRHLLYGVDVYSNSMIGSEKDFGYSGYTNNDINLWGKKIFNSYVASANVFYSYNRHYFYGSQDYKELDIKKKDYRAAYHNVGFDLSYNKIERDNSFQHKADFSLNYTTSKLKSKELDLHLLLDAYKKVKFFGQTEQTLGLTFDYKHAFRKYKGDWDGLTAPLTYTAVEQLYLNAELNDISRFSSSRALFNISPYFIFDYKKFHFFASLAIIPKINGYNDFQMLPTATISFEVIPNILSLYGGLKSEVKLPTLYQITKENPFVAPYIRLQDESDANLFVKAFLTISPNAQLSLEGGMTDMRNHHFYYNLPIDSANVLNTMNVEYANAQRYYATLETHFNISTAFDLSLDATIQKVDRKDDITAYYTPAFFASMKARYKYEDKLFITLSPTFKTKQKARFILEEKELKPMIDINLDATYQYNNNWSFFVDLQNLAFQKYELYYNYPTYNFIFLLGATYKF